VRKHLRRTYANTNSYTDVHGKSHGYIHSDSNADGYSHADSHTDRNIDAHSDGGVYSHTNSNSYEHAQPDTNGDGNTNRYGHTLRRVCSRTRVLEKSSQPMAGISVAAWQCDLQPAAIAFDSKFSRAWQWFGVVGVSGNRCKTKYRQRRGRKLRPANSGRCGCFDREPGYSAGRQWVLAAELVRAQSRAVQPGFIMRPGL
jgi:hypothetical protein